MYENRLRKLELKTLKDRRQSGELIQMFKTMSNKNKCDRYSRFKITNIIKLGHYFKYFKGNYTGKIYFTIELLLFGIHYPVKLWM